MLLLGSVLGENVRFRQVGRILRIVGLTGIVALLAIPSTLSLALPVAALFLADELSARAGSGLAASGATDRQ